ncbi:Bardet-Biedl syndrome 12 protein [Eucyclogobius newberryi]|uniref:Bardet-Biedl syndrome 12 protein n=1 Tax=Eucyclogobius newberryi TaxID=166745 RepID=UPI003B590EFC
MAGSTVLTLRHHVGLQKLSALSGITTQCLGPTKTYKIIQDDDTGESALVSSCHRVLENLELTCAVGQLVYETVKAHHRTYKTGSGSLLFMAGAWSRAALECLHREIPIAHIISALSEGMDVCLSVCKQCSIPNKELHATPKAQPVKAAVKNSASHQLPLNNKTQRKLKLSRHFQKPKLENITTTHNTNSEKSKLTDIAKTLSHGHSETMGLVVKASQIQSEQDVTFDVDKISTCLLPSSAESRACVVPGCILPVCTEQVIIARRLEGQHLKVALIDGDLTPSYRHLGYNKPKRLQHVFDLSSSDNGEDDWLERVVGLVLNLEVNVLLIRGVADGDLKNHFWKHSVLVLEQMRLSILKTFASSAGATLVSYATQLNSRCVGTGVSVSIWKDLSNFASKSNRETYLNVCTVEKSGLVTAVLSSWVQGKLQSEEDAFLACAYRLYWALKDKSLLPGAGVTEMFCIRRLQKLAGLYAGGHKTVPSMNPWTAAGPGTGVVLQLMADAFIDFVSSVMVNAGKYSKVEARTVVVEQLHDWDGSVNCAKMSQMTLEHDPLDGQCNVCDNVSVKQEAWRKALDLVFLVLQTDAEVITGVGQKRLEQGDLIVL